MEELKLAVTRVLEAATECASNPNNRSGNQDKLIASVTDLTALTLDAVNIVNRRKLFQQLEVVARKAAGDATSHIEVCTASKVEAGRTSAELSELTASLQTAVQVSHDNPVSAQAQSLLLEQSEEFSATARELLNRSKSAINTIDNQEAKTDRGDV